MGRTDKWKAMLSHGLPGSGLPWGREGRVTLQSAGHLFKSAAESSWWNTRTSGFIRTQVVNIHGHFADSIRRRERCGRGQVMVGGVPTWVRALLDADPGEFLEKTKAPPELPSCAGGQCCVHPSSWDAAEGQRPIKSAPPGRERGQKFRSHSECGRSFVSLIIWSFLFHSQVGIDLFVWQKVTADKYVQETQRRTETECELEGPWELRRCWWETKKERKRWR